MEIHLIPDKTAVFQLVIFTAVLAGLSYLVFRPLKRVIEERHNRTERLLAETKEIEERIKMAAEEHNAALSEARAKALEEKGKIRQEGLDEEAEIRAKARAEASAMINNARESIALAKEQALNEIRKEIPDLASKVIDRIKGR